MIRNSISSRVIDQPAQQVKGKSFRFFAFDKGQTYVNNDFYQDFVTYAGGLYACIASEVVNEIPDQSDKWMLAVDAIQGKQGGYYIPSYDEKNGTITFTPSGIEDVEAVTTTDIRGTDGKNMEFEWDGFKLKVRQEGDTDWAEKDLRGPGMEFVWDNGKLGVRPEGSDPETSYEFGPDFTGPKGSSVVMQVDASRNMLEYRYDNEETWKDLYDLGKLKGDRGPGVVLFRNAATGDIMMRSEDETTRQAVTLLYADDVKGSDGVSIAKTYIGSDGYLYVCYSDNPGKPMRAGYVRGPKGNDGRQIVLRVDNDIDEFGNKGTGTHIQWKWDGDDYKLWSNLIQVDELMNIAMGGLKFDSEIITRENEEGVEVKYNHLSLNYYKTEYDENNNLVFTDIIQTINSVDIEIPNIYKPVSSTTIKVDECKYDGDVEQMVSMYEYNGSIYFCDLHHAYKLNDDGSCKLISNVSTETGNSNWWEESVGFFVDNKNELIFLGERNMHFIENDSPNKKSTYNYQLAWIFENADWWGSITKMPHPLRLEFQNNPYDQYYALFTSGMKYMFGVTDKYSYDTTKWDVAFIEITDVEDSYMATHNDNLNKIIDDRYYVVINNKLSYFNPNESNSFTDVTIDIQKFDEKIYSIAYDSNSNVMYVVTNMRVLSSSDMQMWNEECQLINHDSDSFIHAEMLDKLYVVIGNKIYYLEDNNLVESYVMDGMATNMLYKYNKLFISSDNGCYMFDGVQWLRLDLNGILIDFIVKNVDGIEKIYLLNNKNLYICEISTASDVSFIYGNDGWVPLSINGNDIDGSGNFQIVSDDDSIVVTSILNGVDLTINRSVIDGKISNISVVKIPETEIQDETIASSYKLVDEYGNQLGSVISILKDKFLKSVNYNEETKQLEFTFIVADGSEQMVGVEMDVAYNTTVNDDLPVAYAVGGIAKGTKASNLKGKTFTEIFDTIFFPTIQPTIVNPSVSIINFNNRLIEVGENWPMMTEANVNAKRGTANAGSVSQVYAGVPTGTVISTTPADQMGKSSSYGSLQYKAAVTFAAGEELKDSKGNPATVAAYPGGIVNSSVQTVNARYMAYANGVLSESQISSLPSSNEEHSLLINGLTYYAGYASETVTGVRAWFDFHTDLSITKVEFYNTVSKAWETFGSGNFVVTESASHDTPVGDGIAYHRWTTIASLAGSLQYRFTLQYNG